MCLQKKKLWQENSKQNGFQSRAGAGSAEDATFSQRLFSSETSKGKRAPGRKQRQTEHEQLLDNLKIQTYETPPFRLSQSNTLSLSLLQRANRIGSNKKLDGIKRQDGSLAL